MTEKEAINFGKTWLDMNEDSKDSRSYEFVRVAIKALEQPEQRWIDIRETKPDESHHILVTYDFGENGEHDYEASEIDYGVTKYGAEHGNGYCKYLIDHIIAWMPLPEPYQERRTDD